MGVIRESFSSSVTEIFEPLPYPENIVLVVTKNPRLKQLKSSNMLNMSVELTIEWDHPLSESITSYEIYTTSNNSYLCAYDRFGERVGTVVNGSLTNFSQTFSTLVADQDTPMLVLVIRSTSLQCCVDLVNWEAQPLITRMYSLRVLQQLQLSIHLPHIPQYLT